MKRSKRFLIVSIMAALILSPACFAEEAEPAPVPPPKKEYVPSEQTPEKPATDASSDTTGGNTTETLPVLSDDPAPESIPTPEPAPTFAPEEDPVPTEAPQEDPRPTETPEETDSPEVQPTDSPVSEPTDAPTEEPHTTLSISVQGNAQYADGIWQIPVLGPNTTAMFSWQNIGIQYNVTITDSVDTVVFQQQTAQNSLSVSAENYMEDTYTLTVQAITADDTTVTVHTRFAFISDGKPFGPHGFHFPRGFRGFGTDSEGMENEPRIVPGEALTNSHSAGTKDMRIYGTYAVQDIDVPVNVLTLDGEEFPLTLDDGEHAFTASVSESSLILLPESDAQRWSFNADLLSALKKSSIDSLTLTLADQPIIIDTDMEFTGRIYASLRASGKVSKDFRICVSQDQMTVKIGSVVYEITSDYELKE